MGQYEDFLQRLVTEGRLDPDVADEIAETSGSTAIRRELREAQAAVKTLTEQNDKFKATATKSAFEQAGIKVKPDSLRLPDDLDVTDVEALRTWAVDQGLAEPAPPSEQEQQTQAELGAHQQIAAAATGAANTRPLTPQEQLLRDTDPSAGVTADQFWNVLEQAGMKA